jgi:hypothetical protein
MAWLMTEFREREIAFLALARDGAPKKSRAPFSGKHGLTSVFLTTS